MIETGNTNFFLDFCIVFGGVTLFQSRQDNDWLYSYIMTTRAIKKVLFLTVGCRLNQYETEKMAKDLAPYGFCRVRRGEPADLYIINTCTVTHRADRDCRYLIRKAARENPNARIVVVGCYVETDPVGIAGLDDVDIVIRNNEKQMIARILSERLPELFDTQADNGRSTDLKNIYERNRAWVKVSDGCNQSCSYCLVTIVRGELTIRPAGEIIDEINSLVVYGYREVVLTAVNMGYYKSDISHPPVNCFADLCRKILKETDIYRLRLSSLEPQTVTPELLDVFANSEGRICPHWHLPMQSGSSRILRLMRRPYDSEMFLKKLTVVKRTVPGTIVGVDVIAGFPGEKEDDFALSRSLAKSGLIDYLHVFSYSDRKGTSAMEMPNKIDPRIIKERVRELREISKELQYRAHQRQIGRCLEVISEFGINDDDGFLGVAENYLRVRLPAGVGGGKEIIKVNVTSAHEDYIEGDILA